MLTSFDIHFKNTKSELCELGKKWDTDKSSQLEGSDRKHSHPYTVFYNSLFESRRQDNLSVAEIGILDGGSLLMWDEYFPNSKIYGFEYYDFLIDNFKSHYNRDRVILSHMDVTNKDSIVSGFQNTNVEYDIIIEDSTHEFEDQIRVIENVHRFLKPGGILIIEDIFKHHDENKYIERLKHVLHHFQSYYFVSMDHNNRYSGNWNNDKVLVFVKHGEPIFKKQHKVTLLTGCSHPEKLMKLRKRINFEFIHEWIIVYDGSIHVENPKQFEYDIHNKKIKEYIINGTGSVGNAQKNYAFEKIKDRDTYVYFLEEDTIIHPHFYDFLNIIDAENLYTFNQENRFTGEKIAPYRIEISMCLLHYNLCKDIIWKYDDKYTAGGNYITDCFEKNKNKWVFVNADLCYGNK